VFQQDLPRRAWREKWDCSAVALLLAAGLLAGSAQAQSEGLFVLRPPAPGLPSASPVIASSIRQTAPPVSPAGPVLTIAESPLPTLVPTGPMAVLPEDGWVEPGGNPLTNLVGRGTDPSLQPVSFIPAFPAVGRTAWPLKASSAKEAGAAITVSPGAALALGVGGPAALSPGEPLPFEIVVRNTGTVVLNGVRVEQILPAGVQVLKTEPPAETGNDRLVWILDNLEVHGERRLRVQLQPGILSEINLEPKATFRSAEGLRTRIMQPAFAVLQDGPEMVQQGNPVVVNIQVANNGPTALHRVTIRDQLPAGLQHVQGDLIEAELGTLQPGETKTVPLEMQAMKTGQLVNEIVASSQEGPVSRSRLSILVKEPGLFLQVSGQKQARAGDLVDLKLAVHNPSQHPATKVQMQVIYPEGLEIIGSSVRSQIDTATRVVFWSLPQLPSGQMQEIVLQVRGRSAGDWLFQASVVAEGLAAARSVQTLRVSN
jgi:uncharacterized repeat protein (TIGR01451 family)